MLLVHFNCKSFFCKLLRGNATRRQITANLFCNIKCKAQGHHQGRMKNPADKEITLSPVVIIPSYLAAKLSPRRLSSLAVVCVHHIHSSSGENHQHRIRTREEWNVVPSRHSRGRLLALDRILIPSSTHRQTTTNLIISIDTILSNDTRSHSDVGLIFAVPSAPSRWSCLVVIEFVWLRRPAQQRHWWTWSIRLGMCSVPDLFI